MPNPTFRLLTSADLMRIIAIEQQNIYPWSAQNLQDCFEVGYAMWGVEESGQLVGYAVLRILGDESEILNITIVKDHQRKGLGLLLMQCVLGYMAQQGAQKAYLEVRESNQAGIALYKKLGFEVIGTRKHYYPTVQGREDAIVFQLPLKFPV